MISLPTFSDFFTALWGDGPFPWQTMLADRIAGGRWPAALDLPTASGKTACMDIAIWALAQQADRPVSERTAPRRIWFVVDRRIVVDEAHDRATLIAGILKAATNGPLATVAARLKDIGGTDRPLAVARLRGGVLRDDGWARLPSQPAVITSTVDQLGSRLLFRGYGRSHLTASIFAGLAAHESLILLDEAHCSVPFLQTLRAVERLRGEKWAEKPVRTPFASVVLSATPPPDIPKTDIFPGHDREQALDHPVLNVRRKASKSADLILIEKGGPRDPIVDKAVERTRCYLLDHGKRRVAVILNRVRTAASVASRLRADLNDSVDIVLLTGRLRPFERDSLVERWKPFLRAKSPDEPARPVALVSTQCIEVGADFSFDALVTEAASLDALRQRFGRLDRLGAAGHSSAAILIRKKDAEGETDDPIYGSSIAACWNLLDGYAARSGGGKVVDFGIEMMDGQLAEIGDPSPYLAPTPDAPSLLPAHLDLLAQTSPPPRPDPDIQLFLHGIGRGVPEARVVWRSDLDEAHPETWAETVALCPPASSEALSISLFGLRRWLAQAEDDDDVEDVDDVEGMAGATPGQHGEVMRPVLRWAGRKRSHNVERTTDIRPNDLVVVPAGYGMVPSGQSEPEMALGPERLDLWEPARKTAGRPAALRLHRSVLEPWLDCPPLGTLVALAGDPAVERDELWEAVDTAIAYRAVTDEDPAAPPEWVADLLRATRHGRVEEHPDGGLVLFARGGQPDAEPDLFADDDDLLSAAGREVPLAEHTESVRRAVAKMATRCLDETLRNPLAIAADWHDVGKLDERLQIVLHRGDELAAAVGEPLAKSAEIPSSPARRRAIQAASGLPHEFRHEMLSLQLAQRHAPLPQSPEERDLVLHLIASHHGHGRPFAPVSVDADPPAIIGTWEDVTIDLNAVDRAALAAPHSLASGIPERYGRLTERYGWWGLAYIEAVLRLGDWYGSQFTQADPTDVSDLSTKTIRSSTVPGPPVVSAADPIVLTGIDGANPLGFLAALGTLTALHAAGLGEVRLGWRRSAMWQPVLTGLDEVDRSYVAQKVADALRGEPIEDEAEDTRRAAEQRYDTARKALNDKREEIKDRRLTGKERKDVVAAEMDPLKIDVDRRRDEWRVALRRAVPSLELAIGKHIDCTVQEYRENAVEFMNSMTGDRQRSNRKPLDFLAAFGSDACLQEGRDTLVPTPFCFTTGSGHQYFLDTVRQLMDKLDPERVQAALFEPWPYRDRKFSMRWDPTEVQRYALRDRKPSNDGGSPTVWMANLLAYRALALFPSAPSGGHLVTTAWSPGGSTGGEPAFTWPIWLTPIDPHALRFLLRSADLVADRPDNAVLRARSVLAAFRARRIKVGSGANYKVNFSPATRIQ